MASLDDRIPHEAAADEAEAEEAEHEAVADEEEHGAAADEEEGADDGAGADAAAGIDGPLAGGGGAADVVGFGGAVGGIWAAAAAAGDVGLDALKRLSDERKALTAQRRRLRQFIQKEEQKRQKIMNLSDRLSDEDLQIVIARRAVAKAKALAKAAAKAKAAPKAKEPKPRLKQKPAVAAAAVISPRSEGQGAWRWWRPKAPSGCQSRLASFQLASDPRI